MKSYLTKFIILTLLSLATPLFADEAAAPSFRKTFFVGADLGVGGFSVGTEATGAGLGGLKIGGGLNENVLIMAEMNLAVQSNSEHPVAIGTGMISAQLFLNDAYYVKGGVGFARAVIDNGGVTVVTRSGRALQVATGYEFKIFSGLALSPEAKFGYANIDTENVTWYGVVVDARWYF